MQALRRSLHSQLVSRERANTIGIAHGSLTNSIFARKDAAMVKTRSGTDYGVPTAAAQFSTNLQYSNLLLKAMAADDALNDRREAARESGDGVAVPSPTTLSPASTVPSSPLLLPTSDEEGLSINDAQDEALPSPLSTPFVPTASTTVTAIIIASATPAVTSIPSQWGHSKEEVQAKRAADRDGPAKWGDVPNHHGPSFVEKDAPRTIFCKDVNAAIDYMVTNGAYTVKSLDGLAAEPWTLLELQERGFTRFNWDGIMPYVILDKQGRIIAVLIGRPEEDDKREPEHRWPTAIEHVADLLETTRNRGSFTASNMSHRRGNFAAYNVGVSYGDGQKIPAVRKHSSKDEALIETLLSDKDVQRIAHFQSQAMASYFPKVYAHLHEAMQALANKQPELKQNFRGSIYPSITFNLGPKTECIDHNDCGNAPDVPCAVTSLGDFNADDGGDVYLWDLRLCIRFPAGSTILLSSAGMHHGNTPITKGEHRYSITQYCAGGLLRWVRLGFRPADKVPARECLKIEGTHEERWRTILGRLSKYVHLDKDRAWLLAWEKEQKRSDAV
ncbi:hypothetical protein EVG20_g11309 [Dentipellis fragilis]|uniref:Uncharacterized protein n=1 Tax=Dentipellis fragilis TaxID=205917 RepID=A0A4Y9XN78_9AGAM|nr:hypothetical protein EVG20_g11309 [Dentipellis fragilis]